MRRLNRIVSIIIALLINISAFPYFWVHAEGSIMFIPIKIGEATRYYNVIEDKGDILMACEDIGSITGYSYTLNGNNAIFKRGAKTINIDCIKSRFTVTGLSKPIALTKVIKHEEEYYLPLAELLPWLNVTCTVDNGALVIAIDMISIWDILNEFDAEKYNFDFYKACEEAGVNAKWLKVSSYILNKIGKIVDVIPIAIDIEKYGDEWSLDVTTYGSYKEYYDIFDDMLKDINSKYAAVKEIVNITQKSKSIFDTIDIFDGMENMEDMPDEVKALYAMLKGAALAGKGFKAVDDIFISYYVTNEDNMAKIEMLDYMTSNRLAYNYDNAALYAAWDIMNAYYSKLEYIKNKALRWLIDWASEHVAEQAVTSIDQFKKVLSYIGVLDEVKNPWRDNINHISKYAKLQKSGLYVFDAKRGLAHKDDIALQRTHVMMYLYFAEKGYSTMQSCFESKGKLKLAKEYKEKAEECKKWYGKFLVSRLSETNDSINYGNGRLKETYTKNLLKLFKQLDLKKQPDPLFNEEILTYLGLTVSEANKKLDGLVECAAWPDGIYCIYNNDIVLLEFSDYVNPDLYTIVPKGVSKKVFVRLKDALNYSGPISDVFQLANLLGQDMPEIVTKPVGFEQPPEYCAVLYYKDYKITIACDEKGNILQRGYSVTVERVDSKEPKSDWKTEFSKILSDIDGNIEMIDNTMIALADYDLNGEPELHFITYMGARGYILGDQVFYVSGNGVKKIHAEYSFGSYTSIPYLYKNKKTGEYKWLMGNVGKAPRYRYEGESPLGICLAEITMNNGQILEKNLFYSGNPEHPLDDNEPVEGYYIGDQVITDLDEFHRCYNEFINQWTKVDGAVVLFEGTFEPGMEAVMTTKEIESFLYKYQPISLSR